MIKEEILIQNWTQKMVIKTEMVEFMILYNIYLKSGSSKLAIKQRQCQLLKLDNELQNNKDKTENCYCGRGF